MKDLKSIQQEIKNLKERLAELEKECKDHPDTLNEYSYLVDRVCEQLPESKLFLSKVANISFWEDWFIGRHELHITTKNMTYQVDGKQVKLLIQDNDFTSISMNDNEFTDNEHCETLLKVYHKFLEPKWPHILEMFEKLHIPTECYFAYLIQLLQDEAGILD